MSHPLLSRGLLRLPSGKRHAANQREGREKSERQFHAHRQSSERNSRRLDRKPTHSNSTLRCDGVANSLRLGYENQNTASAKFALGLVALLRSLSSSVIKNLSCC
jgi:hypothetical protein